MQLFVVDIPHFDPDEATLAALLAHLDSASCARIARFHHRADALRCLVGRLLPLWLCKREHEQEPERAAGESRDALPEIAHSPHGKPYFADPALHRALAFNISHDAQVVLLGVHAASPSSVAGAGAGAGVGDPAAGRVGVDVMRLPVDRAEQAILAETVQEMLHRTELAHLHNLPPAARLPWLLRVWTLKESYAKSLGVGLALDFQTLETGFEGAGADMRPSASTSEAGTAGEGLSVAENKCGLCAGRVRLAVDDAPLPPGWHAEVGCAQVGGDAYLWAATWFQGSGNGGGACALEMRVVHVDEVVRELLGEAKP